MKPAYKRTPSDCFARCVESLVGHLTGDVPNFVVGSDSNERQVRRCQRWLKKYDLGLVFVSLDNDRRLLYRLPITTYCILFLSRDATASAAAWAHAVVGKVSNRRLSIVHDPDHFEEPVGSVQLTKRTKIDAVGFIVHGDMVVRGAPPRPPAINPEE